MEPVLNDYHKKVNVIKLQSLAQHKVLHFPITWQRFASEWIVITMLCFLLFELEALPYNGIMAVLSDTHDMAINIVFSAIFSLSSLLLCAFVYHNQLYIRKPTFRRWSFLLVVIINFLLSIILTRINGMIFPDFANNDTAEDIFESAIVTALCSMVIVVQNYNNLITQYEQRDKLSRLKLLKFQLNPHFIFNSLSILAGLIDTNPQSAEDFTLKMSRVYRYITKNIGKDLVTVDDALNFAHDYIAMMEMRYPDAIKYETYDLQGAVHMIVRTGFIPSMTMQLLIENAVKHNPPSADNKLHITVTVDDENITVTNNLNKSDDGNMIKSTGIGLDNLTEQYKLLSDETPTIKKTETSFIVILPIIKKRDEEDTDNRG